MVAAEDIDSFFAKQDLRPELLTAAGAFREQYPWQGQRHVNKPRFPYFGRDILAKAVAALLAGVLMIGILFFAGGKFFSEWKRKMNI